MVIPDSLKQEVLKLCHNIPTSAHQGITRTKSKVVQSYFWHKLSKDVKLFVIRCHSCNINKINRKNKFLMVQNHSGTPMEKVHIDFLGPLPKSKNGNEYILVIVDNFSKWIECIPLPFQTAEVTARAAINHCFSRYGYPSQLVSDQGRNFESSLFKEMSRILHIKKSRTTAYRPSANGQAERMNRTLIAAIRCYGNKKKDD